jgi:tRNA pseudouridine32 synthase/23S rRNA pseudouridine746 synthase
MKQRLSFEFLVGAGEDGYLCDLLHQKSGLSKAKIKTALQCGACRVQKKGFKTQKRVRKAKALIQAGDRISFYYDPGILSLQLPAPQLLQDHGNYTIWDKPAGMLSQASPFADHCSMTRQVELLFAKKRPVFLVHRLDREASGLFLLAHDKKSAAQFSAIWRNRLVEKTYLVEVLGELEAEDSGLNVISTALDGKPAETNYEVLSYCSESNTSRLTVQISSGRLHQIRRHFEAIGHPVMGDSRYGKGNKNSAGLRLRAIRLSFTCPVSHRFVAYQVQSF